MASPSADRDSARRERDAWRREAIAMMARLCNAADSAETERDEARDETGRLREALVRRHKHGYGIVDLRCDACAALEPRRG